MPRKLLKAAAVTFIYAISLTVPVESTSAAPYGGSGKSIVSRMRSGSSKGCSSRRGAGGGIYSRLRSRY